MSTSRARRAGGGAAGLAKQLEELRQLVTRQQEELAAQRERADQQQEDLDARLAAQQGEIERLRAERAEAAPASPLILPAKFRGPGAAADGAASERANGRHSSRRRLLKLGGIAAAAVGAGVLLSEQGRPALAAPGHATTDGISGYGVNAGNNGVGGYGTAGANGIYGQAGAGTGGQGVMGVSFNTGGAGVLGVNRQGTSGNTSIAVWGDATNGGSAYGNGVQGEADNGDGVHGTAWGASGNGVQGTAPNGTNANPSVGVKGDTTNGLHIGFGYGVWGITDGGIGVLGTAPHGTQANFSNGVQGDATNGGNGVGNGVTGYADTGYGARGYCNVTGAGVYGQTFGVGNGVEGHAATGNGVAGVSNSGQGVVGISTGGDGVEGQTSAGGHSGVRGHSTAAGAYGVTGTAPNGIDFYAGSGRIWQTPLGSVGAPTSGTFHTGESIRDAAGDLWLCVKDGPPGTWLRVAAVQPGYAGGSLNLLPVAASLLDTRGGAPVAYHATVQFQAAGVGGILAGATAVLGHLAAGPRVGVSCGDGSSAILWPSGQPRPGAVNVVYNNPVDTLGQCLTGTLALVAVGAGGQISLYSQPINPVAVDYLFDCFGFVM
jgi:hypothetical protein